MTDTNCPICVDKFNKSTRTKSQCPYCHTSICRTCLQTYVLNDITDTPRCINPDCGHVWARDFLDGEFSRVFRLGTYKEHREKILVDREKARLPATQEDAAAYKDAKRKYEVWEKEADVINKQIRELEKQVSPIQHNMYNAQQVIQTYGRRRMIDSPLAIGGTQLVPLNTQNTQNTIEHVAPKEATFIRPCPSADCKGYLSSAWKCGLCEQWTCPDCHELKGARRDVEHTCNPENVATAALITRESKACPKCGVRICKIDGCDQMWCTACNTAFHWRTGEDRRRAST